MKLSKAAETQRMSHRGFQSEQGIGERTFMDKQERE